jgi:hypothetical protein
MAIDKINRTNFVPTKLPIRVPAEKVNEIIDLVNELEETVSTDFPSTVTAAAATDALIIDAATTDHTGDALIDIDADVNVNNANNVFNAINVNYDITVALGAGEIASGVKVVGDGLAADVDTSAILGVAVDLTSPTTSRADTVGVLIGIDSVRSTADTDSGFMVAFTGTMNHASAGTYGLRVGSTGFTHTAGTYWGAYINVGHEAVAGSAIGVAIDADSTSDDNSKYGVVISKDLTNATAAGAVAVTNEALSIAQVVASSALASGAATASNNMVYLARTNSTAVASADVYGGNLLATTYSATTSGTGTATNSACSLLIDYNITETAGTLTNSAFNVAYIDFDTTGTPVFGAGTYNMLLIDCDTAASIAAAATTYLNGIKVDLGGVVVTDADLAISGLSITLPAYGTSTQYGVHVTDATYQAFLVRNETAGYFTNGTNTLYLCDATYSILSTGPISVGTSAARVTIAGTDQQYLAYTTSSTATAVVVSSAVVNQVMTGASAVNMVEAAQFIVTSAVQMGNWANAIVGKIDLSTTGYATGLAGVICAELDLPSTDPAGGSGTYTCFEAELGIPNAYTSTVPVSFMNMNVWGVGGAGGLGVFLDNGFLFDITGLGAAAASHIFQANTDQPTHALRIRIDGVAYYMLLTSVNNGAE